VEDVQRLWRIARLQERGVRILDTATLAQVEAIETKREAVRYFHAKVVGVSNINADGTSRQAVITKCHPREILRLKHDKENAFDPNAVAVLRSTGEQLGYLDADLAAEVAPRMDDGRQYIPVIKAIRSDGVASHSRGVLLILIVAKPGIPMEEIRAFTKEVVLPALEAR
jgi:hypothetical protein